MSQLVWSATRVKSGIIESLRLRKCLISRYGKPINLSILNSRDLSYLAGLVDAGIDEAKLLIKAICEHDEIHIKEEF